MGWDGVEGGFAVAAFSLLALLFLGAWHRLVRRIQRFI